MNTKNHLDTLIEQYLTGNFLDSFSEEIANILTQEKKIITVQGDIVDMQSCISPDTLSVFQKKIFGSDAKKDMVYDMVGEFIFNNFSYRGGNYAITNMNTVMQHEANFEIIADLQVFTNKVIELTIQHFPIMARFLLCKDQASVPNAFIRQQITFYSEVITKSDIYKSLESEVLQTLKQKYSNDFKQGTWAESNIKKVTFYIVIHVLLYISGGTDPNILKISERQFIQMLEEELKFVQKSLASIKQANN